MANKRIMSKRTGRWLKWPVIILSLLMLIVIAGWIAKSKVKKILLEEINQQLLVKVDADRISIQLIRSFPQVSLEFIGVSIPSLPGDTLPLLRADRLSLQFNLWDLIRKRYNIRHIGISKGKLFVHIPEKGDANYLILKEGEGEDVEINLRRVLIRDVDIVYHDPGNRVQVLFQCRRTTFRGNFSAEAYRLKADGAIRIDRIRVGAENFFSGQDAEIGLVMDIDLPKELYTIKTGRLTVEGLPFLVSGTITDKKGEESIDLGVEGDRLLISHVLQLLPDDGEHFRELYDPQGKVSFKGTIAGSYAGGAFPGIRFLFGVDNASVRQKKTKLELREVSLQGEYLYTMNESHINLTGITSRLGDGAIAGNLSLTDLKNPVLKLDLTSELSVADLLGFFPVQGIVEGQGHIRVNLLAETGIAHSDRFNVTHLLNSRTNGEVEMSGVSFVLEKDRRSFSKMNGRLVFDNNDVKVKDFAAGINTSAFSFTGYFRNLLPFLLMENQQLECKGTLRSASVNMNDVLFGNTEGDKEGSGTAKLPANISGSFDVLLERMSYGDFNARNVSGRLRIEPGRVYAEKVRMTACNGEMQGSVVLSQQQDGGFTFDGELNTSQADISMLFRQFRNFGQDDLVDKNLKGKLTSRMRVHSRLTPSLGFVLPTVEAIGELIVEEGALLNYEPVKALSRYTRLDDLSNIRFSTLKNEIRITNETVIIPEMMIRSDAVDLALSGTQTFDGKIEYHLRMHLSELLSGKVKKERMAAESSASTEEDAKGRITLHIVVEGTVDKPVVRYDRRGYREKVKNDLTLERKEIRELFQKEFGTFITPEPPQEKNKGRKEGEILIEWEED